MDWCVGNLSGGSLPQEAGEAAVGERLAAGLAGGAVVDRVLLEGDLADAVAAARAGLPAPVVHLVSTVGLGGKTILRKRHQARDGVPEHLHDGRMKSFHRCFV